MFTLEAIGTLSDFIFGFIEGIIVLRILLKFFGAHEFVPFVSWIFQTSQPLLDPFEGMFPSVLGKRGFTIDVSSLFALLVYAFVAYLIQEGIGRLETAKLAQENGNGKRRSRKDED